MTHDSGSEPMWAQTIQAVTGVLFPRTCAGCQRFLDDGGTDFCSDCAPPLSESVGRPGCTRCGRTIGLYVSPENVCATCRNEAPLTEGLVRVGPYEGPLESMIRLYKFRAAYHLEKAAVRLLAARLQTASWLERVEALVPVPTHWSRRRVRGEYLAGRLALGVARAVGLRCESVVRRTRGGPAQFELTTAAERKANVRGAFAPVRGARLKNASLCLVDDVSTTGATLAEVRRVLRAAGAASVYAAVLAKAG